MIARRPLLAALGGIALLGDRARARPAAASPPPVALGSEGVPSREERAAALRARAPIVLPRDFGAHPDARLEWWYLTAALAADGGAPDPFGVQLTFFRRRTDVANDHPSAFAARQLIFAHAAVTDLRGGRLRHDQAIARAGFGIAQASEFDTDLRLRGWSLRREAGTGGDRYIARAASSASGFAFELQLDAIQPVLLQGDAGISRKGPAQTSHYLSEPQLAARGRLRVDGGTRAVTGRGWLDHEWSDELLPSGAVGWDWIGMNLDDGGALTAFRLRSADGAPLWAGGSLRPRGGAAQAFGAQDVRFTPLRRWRSAATGATYPVQWQVDTPAGRYEVRPLLDDQELDSRASTGTIYWEGLSDLLDAGGRRVGRGYLELTGYASPLRLG